MNDGWKRRIADLGLGVLFVLVLARTVLRAKPFTNWDLLVYMALALEWECDDPVEVHRRTYAAAEAELPAPVFAWLTGAGLMRARYEDPQAFHEQLGFFRSRVLYSGLVELLHRAGVPLARAPHAIALATWVGLALLFALWARRHLALGTALAASLLLVHAPPLLSAASYATADTLAALLALAGIHALHERRARRTGALLLVLAVLARTDSIVFVLPWVLGLAWAARGDRAARRALGATAAASVVAYLGLALWAHDYGWWPLFQVSFVGKTLHPSELPTRVDLGLYGQVVSDIAGALPGDGYLVTERTVVGSTLALVYAGLCLLGIAVARRVGERGGTALLLAALLGATLVRWLLFPRLWDRYHVLFYAAVPLVLLSLAGRILRERERASDGVA